MVDADLRMLRVSTSIQLRKDLPQVMAERGQLQQVFLNLITNAIEAMHDIADRPRILQVRSDTNNDVSSVRITVEDTGTGIDGKDTEHFFEPFLQRSLRVQELGLTCADQSSKPTAETFRYQPIGLTGQFSASTYRRHD